MYEEDSKSRPLKLPPYVQSSPTFRVGFHFDGKPWQVRIASVRANGEPWLDCDEVGWPLAGTATAVMDWPHPEPGLGMEHDDGGPSVHADWPPLPLPTGPRGFKTRVPPANRHLAAHEPSFDTPQVRYGGNRRAGLARLGAPGRDIGKEPEVAGKKRPKSQGQTKKTPTKAKRPKKTSRGK
jgi:hypothetical protein